MVDLGHPVPIWVGIPYCHIWRKGRRHRSGWSTWNWDRWVWRSDGWDSSGSKASHNRLWWRHHTDVDELFSLLNEV